MPETKPQPGPAPTGVSMYDLLASCAAAAAVSTPPCAPEPEARRAPVPQHREAA
ncbi:hypothetical protein ACFUAC_25730 [Streptomyces sp. NPDC057148]|uniref:hypothetical protein n=1 Tax=unclassified Streptomyces TaxID=2593676 RepID=UPI0036401DCE